MKFCPTCGNPQLPIELRVDLNENVVMHRGKAVRLTPREAEVLFVLAEEPGRTVPHSRLCAKIYGLQSVEVNEMRTMHVIVSKLRQKIAPLHLNIPSSHHNGYRLLIDTKPGMPGRKKMWSSALVARFTKLCKQDTPRNIIARELDMRVDQVVSLHAYLGKHCGFEHPLAFRDRAIRARAA